MSEPTRKQAPKAWPEVEQDPEVLAAAARLVENPDFKRVVLAFARRAPLAIASEFLQFTIPGENDPDRAFAQMKALDAKAGLIRRLRDAPYLVLTGHEKPPAD